MDNQIALLIIIVVIALSRRVLLPMLIASFYVMYMSIDSYAQQSGMIDSSWYLVNALMDLIVLLLSFAILCSGKGYVKTTFLFMIYVCLFYLVPDVVLFVSAGKYFEQWAVLLYETVMNYAIYIDILFCIVGSDNVLSRQIFKDK